MKKEKISVIVPCFNEQEALPYFYEEIKKIEKEMNFLDFEYIFVEDGSKDKTLEILRDFSKKDKHVRYLSLSRNFGKEASMYAGLKYATGDYVTIMDADLQDPPTLLPEMYKYIKEEGYDQVATRRANRKGEPIIRSFFAKMFYKIINKMSKVEMVDGARDFRLMKRQVVDSILELSEYNRYSKGLFSFVGYNTKWIEYNNIERVAGKTKWSFWKLFKYAIEGITAFSTVPLAFASFLGVLMCLLAIVFIIIIIVKTIIYGDPVGGWPSLACIILFTSGVQLLCLGIMGQYLSKAYLESKNRPIYIIKEHDNN